MKLQIILDALPFSVYWLDSKKKLFVGGNLHFFSLLNIGSLAELIDKPISNIFVSDYLRIANDLFNKSIKNKGKSFSAIYHKVSNDHGDSVLIQCVSITSKKESITIFSEINPSLKDFNQYLWEENEKLTIYLNNIIENVPASLYWKDTNSVILGGSKLHTELTGFSDSKAVIGKTDFDFSWKDQAERIQENDRFVMQNNQMVSFEERAKLSDDSMHIFLTQKSPLRGKFEKIIGVLGVSIDITELKNTQKKLKKSKLLADAANQAKTEFLANMSHDIRTPLTGIIGLSQLLEERLKIVENKNDLGLMHKASQQLLNLLNNVLDVASLENANEAQLKVNSFSLQDLVESLKDLLLPSVKTKGLTLQVNLDVSITENIVSDQNKLERILLNLATNAIKFTEKGTVVVTIKELESLPQQVDGVYIEFTICDTGIGIPADKLTSVFDPFFRITPSFANTDQTQGYGVGLHIVKKFINLLGGEIQVKSEIGVGTSFTFTLFMNLAKKNKLIKFKNKNSEPFVFLETNKLVEAKKLQSEQVQLPKKPIKKHILLIEDDLLTIKFSQELLTQAGYNLTVVSTMQEALPFAKNHKFDLIIADLGLPGLSGNEIAVLYRYWERINQKPLTPIITLTAHGEGKFKEECLAAGINEIWLKPLTKEKIKKLDKYFQDKKINVIEFNPALKQSKPTKHEYVEENNLTIEKANLLDIINSYPIYDKTISLQNLSGNIDLFNEIIEMFKQSIPGHLQELEKTYQVKDWETIENIVHKIKGGACYAGAVRLNYVCKNFLRCYLTGQTQQLDTLYSYLIYSLKETYKALES
ncbi:ATP-binding protein [Rickettsiella endosymbiont of Miltochrista miniata]|uniref:ATP-binding protein n=1 Tax=Rickettsiella endosymbiont of Miltochrista miniata TaxID=3066239 RepID=UPI00313E57FC